MKNKALVFLLALCPIFVFGQNVFVSGTANKPNALIRLFAYSDMLTNEQIKLAETQSDKDGRFSLAANVKEITPAQIAVNLERVDFILSPNGKYDVEIVIPELKEDASFFEKEHPVLKINKADDGGLYSQYVTAQAHVDDFLYENFNQIYKGRKVYLLDTLDNQLERRFGKAEFDYVKDYVKYRKASVLMTFNKKKTVDKYFDNQKVLYLQASYMNVFLELFKSCFNTREYVQFELKNKFYEGYDSFMAYVCKNDFLSRNRQVAELVTIIEFRRFYYENFVDRNKIIEYLNTIKNTSKYLKNREVASNMANKLLDLSYDSDAPQFSLKDKDGKTVKLTDYQNDMVLLQFVNKVSPMIDREFGVLNELQNQWNDTIQVVTIASSEAFEDYVQLFEKQGYKWTLLNLENNILLLEDYHVKTYPAYVILKRKNKIGMAPAPAPEQYLDFHVRRISKY